MTGFDQNDQAVNTQFNVGRDQIIHNLVLVGQFLDFTKIEGFIPKPISPNEYNNVVEAFENVFANEGDGNLTQAAAFVGEVLREIVEKWTPTKPFQVLPIRTIVSEAPNIIFCKLVELNFWYSYCERSEPSFSYIQLQTLSLLWKKNFNDDRFFALTTYGGTNVGCLTYKISIEDDWYNSKAFEYFEPTDKMFRVILAGIIIDLMRIYSKGSDDVKFWNKIVELLSTKPK